MGGPKRRRVPAAAALQMGGGRVRGGEGQLTRLAQTRGHGHCRAGVTGSSAGGGLQTRWFYTLVTVKGKTAQTLKACPLESDGAGAATS